MKGPIEYIKEAVSIYTKKENFVFFAKIMAVVVIFSSAVSLSSGYLYPANYLQNADFSNIPMLVGFIAISLLSIVIGLWSQTTTYFSILNVQNNIIGVEKEVLKLGFAKVFKYLLISLILGLIVLAGSILFIIPAIIFGVWFSFAKFLVLDKNVGIREALRTSKEMVKGRFWKVLGRSFVFGLFTFIVSLVLSLIPYVGTYILSFIAPLFLLPYYLLYRDIDTAGSTSLEQDN